MEITYKVLEKDREIHLRDHTLTSHYVALKERYGDTELSQEGDFRERLSKLSDQLIHEFFRSFGSKGHQAAQNSRLNITTSQVTQVLYQHDIRNLYEARTFLDNRAQCYARKSNGGPAPAKWNLLSGKTGPFDLIPLAMERRAL